MLGAMQAAMLGAGKGGFNVTSLPSLIAAYRWNLGAYNTTGGSLATDGQTVQQWQDQSGNGFHLVQDTSGNRLTYRSAGYIESVSNDWMSFPSGITAFGNDTTVVARCTFQNPSTYWYPISMGAVAGWTHLLFNLSGGLYKAGIWGMANSTGLYAASGMANGTAYTFSAKTFVSSGSRINTYLDGTAVTTNGPITSPSTYKYTDFNTYNGGTTYAGPLKWYGLVICNAALSDTDRANAEAWVAGSI